MASITIDIDLDDLMWDLSKWDKQRLADNLYENGYVPKEVETIDAREPETYLEYELSEVLDKIWDNRRFINNDDLETLKHLSKKGL
jgi:hypothetical protein